jgi:hypothetical protein
VVFDCADAARAAPPDEVFSAGIEAVLVADLALATDAALGSE